MPSFVKKAYKQDEDKRKRQREEEENERPRRAIRKSDLSSIRSRQREEERNERPRRAVTRKDVEESRGVQVTRKKAERETERAKAPSRNRWVEEDDEPWRPPRGNVESRAGGRRPEGPGRREEYREERPSWNPWEVDEDEDDRDSFTESRAGGGYKRERPTDRVMYGNRGWNPASEQVQVDNEDVPDQGWSPLRYDSTPDEDDSDTVARPRLTNWSSMGGAPDEDRPGRAITKNDVMRFRNMEPWRPEPDERGDWLTSAGQGSADRWLPGQADDNVAGALAGAGDWASRNIFGSDNWFGTTPDGEEGQADIGLGNLYNRWGASAEPGSWREPIGESAAWERARLNMDTRNKEFDGAEKKWFDPAAAMGGGAAQAISGFTTAAQNLFDPTKTWSDVGAAAGAAVGGGMNALWDLSQVTAPTRELARGLGHAGDIAQTGQDYLYTRETANNVPLGAYRQAAVDTVWDAVKAVGAMGWEAQGTLDMEKNFRDHLNSYARGTTPTQQQIDTTDPEVRAKARQYAYLTSWADPNAVAASYDAVMDREGRLSRMNTDAQWLMEQAKGAQTQEERDFYTKWAAEVGAETYRLETAHPIELAQAQSNVWAQLFTELLSPDPLDLAGGFFSLAELTPQARRLNRVVDAASASPTAVASKLETIAVGPQARAAGIVPDQTGWARVRQMFGQTGASQAAAAARDTTHLVTTLLADVDTAADARLLISTLIRDPAKLINGIAANLFQSQPMLDRAVDGVVRFGITGMGQKQFTENLNVLRSIGDELLQNSRFLNGEGAIDRLGFMQEEFIPAVLQGGYRRYNVATDLGEAPMATASAKVRTLAGGKAQVEYLDSNGKVLWTSDNMSLSEANGIAGNIRQQSRTGQIRQRNPVDQFGSLMRSIVTPFYITTQPGTWLTNTIGAVGTAAVDGMFGLGRSEDFDRAVEKIYGGIQPTLRSLEGVESAASVVQDMARYEKMPVVGKALQKLSDLYGQLDEWTGKRVAYKATQRAINKMMPVFLGNFQPVLQQFGITDPKVARAFANNILEAARNGDDLMAAAANYLNPRTSNFTLSGVNPLWPEVLPVGDANGSLADFRKMLLAATPETWQQSVNTWADAARKGWAKQYAESPIPDQRIVNTAQETAQDAAEIEQLARQAVKRGVPEAEAKAAVEASKQQLDAINQSTQTLAQIAATAGADTRKYLYGLWATIYDRTLQTREAGTRLVTEVYEKTDGLPQEQANAVWRSDYFDPMRQAWDERNAWVNQQLQQAADNIQAGTIPEYNGDYWKRLEAAASADEQAAWDTLTNNNPRSGRYDKRLAQSIEAGRTIIDRAAAEAFAAASRFNISEAFDFLVSAEASNQRLGAQIDNLISEAYERMVAANGGKVQGSGFFDYRNRLRREAVRDQADNWRRATQQIMKRGQDSEAERLPARTPDAPQPTAAPSTPLTAARQRPLTDPKEIAKRADGLAGDPEMRREINPGNANNLPNQDAAYEVASKATEVAGTSPDDIGKAAAHALQTIETIRDYLLKNGQEILTPSGKVSEQGALGILNEFRKQILPAWDNVKWAAAEFSNEARSFSLLDRTNKYRADELFGTYMPYSFFFTRTVKNTLERQIFAPQYYRRIQQYNEAVDQLREQEGDSEARFKNNLEFTIGGQTFKLNLNWGKYLPMVGGMLHNDFNDPEEANNSFTWAMENAQMMGFSAYPWWDWASKAANGQPVRFGSATPIGRIASATYARLANTDPPNWAKSDNYEYNVGRELELMATEGVITEQEALVVMDLYEQQQSGAPAAKEQYNIPPKRLKEIQDLARKRAMDKEITASTSSWGFGMRLMPYDTDERQTIQASQEYSQLGYSPENPYGSERARDLHLQENPELRVRWAKGTFFDNEQRPIQSAALDMKQQETDKIREEMNAAIDQAIEEQGRDLTWDERDAIAEPYEQRLKDLEKRYPNAVYPDSENSPTANMNPSERATYELERIVATAQEKAEEQFGPRPADLPDTATAQEKSARSKDYQERNAFIYDFIEQQLGQLYALPDNPQYQPRNGEDQWLKELEKQTAGLYAAEIYSRHQSRFATDAQREWSDMVSLQGEANSVYYAEQEERLKKEFGQKNFADFEKYQSLPDDSEERKRLGEQNPTIYRMFAAAYNQEGYESVAQEFGNNWQKVYDNYPRHPGSEASDDQKKAFYAAERDYLYRYPRAQEIKLYVDGRWAPEGTPPEHRGSYGSDWEEAQRLFPGVFEAMANQPDPERVGWPAFYDYQDEHPEIDQYKTWLFETQGMTPAEYMALYPASESGGPPEIDPATYKGPRPYGSDRQPLGGVAGEPSYNPYPSRDSLIYGADGYPLLDPKAAAGKAPEPAMSLTEAGGRLAEANPLKTGAKARLASPASSGGRSGMSRTGKSAEDYASEAEAYDRQNGGSRSGNQFSDDWDTYKSLDGKGKYEFMTDPDNAEFAEYYADKYGAWWLEEDGNYNSGGRGYGKRSRGGGGRYGSGGGSGEFREASEFVTSNFDKQDAALWESYYDLPKGAARERFAEANPRVKVLNFAGYNPDEYNAALEVFTDADLMTWAMTPDDNDAAKAYYDENPEAFLVNAWMYGRPASGYDYDKDNYGPAYDEAKELFGEDIWQVVSQYQRGWDKETKKAFYDEFPQYGEWQDWWYGQDESYGYSGGYGRGYGRGGGGSRSGPGYDGLGNRIYKGGGGGYGGGGGGGGGGSYTQRTQVPFVDVNPLGGSMYSMPGEMGALREWKPEWIRGPYEEPEPRRRQLRKWRD